MAQNITFEHGEKRATDFLNRHLQDIVPDGVYKGFNIRETATPSFSVDAKAETDNTNVVFTLEGVRIEEDTDLSGIATVTTPDTVNPRIDSLFVKHDKTPAKNPAIFELIAGTPDPSPSAPTPPVDGFFRVKLADILVPANATEITNTEITNAAKTSLGFVPVPFATLSDISADESNAFNGMAGRGFNEPSTVNPVATIRDTNGPFLKPTPTSTADDFLQVKGGESWNRRQLVKTTVADASIQIITAPSVNPRIDLVTYDPDTQALAIISGVEAPSPVAPVLTDPGLMPVAFVLVDEISPASIVVNEADITDARALPHNKTPEWFDLPGITSDMKDSVTGAAAPAAGNVFQTAADLTAALAPISTGFVLSRLEFDTGKNATGGPSVDKCRLRASAGQELRVTLHDAGFTKKVFKRIGTNLDVDIGAGVGPGGTDGFVVSASTWYFVYVIGASGNPSLVDLVISKSLVAPNLSDSSFTSPGWDVFRRIGSARLDSSAFFVESFSKNGDVNLLDSGTLDTAYPAATWTFVGALNAVSDFVPPTSRRARCRGVVNENGGPGTSLFVAHPDIGTGSTGGKEVARVGLAGSANTDFEGSEFEIDLDDSQRFKARRGAGFTAPYVLFIFGYTEVL